ncbi:MAG: hypothetical protein IJ529_04295 [Alphaproteobacteria bacterium]|nr:hypothetical protein [Alphaproteobacteria bacterium]MBQ8677669.1 hypothetical protein [Alphaproteobacteria bacterium]
MQKYLISTMFFILLVVQAVSAQVENSYTIEQEAPADSPVIVYGSANEGNGHRDSVLLEQNSENNPLGNPLSFDSSEDPEESLSSPQTSEKSPAQKVSRPFKIQESLPQNPQISAQETPQTVNKQIQNTLYESGGRIYDIQSFPASDVSYIEQPNLNPTITTYPAY